MSPGSDRFLIAETSVYDQFRAASIDRIISSGYHEPSHRKNRDPQYHITFPSFIPRLARASSSSLSPSSSNQPPKFASKRDQYVIEFSDVVMLCQRVGTTNLPSSFADTPNLFPSRSKRNNKPKGIVLGTERNLYKFLEIVKWKESGANRRYNVISGSSGVEGFVPIVAEVGEENADDPDDSGRDGATSRMRLAGIISIDKVLGLT